MKWIRLVAVTTLLPLPLAFADISDGLVAHYRFDGNALDASGYGNHGVVTGAVLAVDRKGAADSCYQFDGLDDFIEVDDSPSLDLGGPTGFSFSVWIKPDTLLECPETDRGAVILAKYLTHPSYQLDVLH